MQLLISLKPTKFLYLLIFIAVNLSSLTQPSVSLAVTPRPAQPGNSSTASEQQLLECVKIAKSGDVNRAFELAKQTKLSFASQRLFTVSYVNTLVTIVVENESRSEVKILNEAIKVVNQVRQTKQYDGKQDPEASYYFMQALGRLAAITAKFNESVSGKVRIYEGQVALALSTNPSYPQNALEALAPPMISMARGYAIRGNQDAAKKALRNAVDVGFGDFETILKDPLLQRLDDREAMEGLVADLKVQYQQTIERWSRTVITEFQPFQFNFDLADVQGGRVSSTEFGGRVVVLDMWATWCAPCRKGIPHFIELQKNLANEGIAVLGVSMDNPNDPNSALTTVRDFAAQNKFNYRCAMGDQSFSAQVPGKQMLPTTLFIDQSGRVRYIARGYHDYAKIEAITKFLASESQPVRTGMPVSN